MSTLEIFETINYAGYTGRFRIAVHAPHYKAGIFVFDLPGRGGKVTKKAAAAVVAIMARGGDLSECAAAGVSLVG
jgi:hypothetical protein